MTQNSEKINTDQLRKLSAAMAPLDAANARPATPGATTPPQSRHNSATIPPQFRRNSATIPPRSCRKCHNFDEEKPQSYETVLLIKIAPEGFVDPAGASLFKIKGD
jgi:hypothetical protein